jgi:hypothetical protein
MRPPGRGDFRISGGDDRVGLGVQQPLERTVDFARVSGIERDSFQAQFPCSGLCVHAFDIDIGIGGIDQQGNAGTRGAISRSSSTRLAPSTF